MSDLFYPFSDLPASGETIEICPGILWVRMPLPMALDHINLYLLEDIDGWWIIDTGIKSIEIKQYWESILDTELAGNTIKGVIVTHMHPDHLGQAGWLCDKFKAPLYMSFGEYYVARSLSNMAGETMGWAAQAHFKGAGMSEQQIDAMKEKSGRYASMVEPVPGTFKRLSEGTVLTINSHKWVVIMGAGHSPEHACLYCEELGVLLSGDQVIPKITSNVSVMPPEPDGNPLSQWLSSLQKFLKIPADTLVLPAHNTPFKGIHYRINFLIEHHNDHLLALEEACVTPKNAMELLPVLFKRELDDSNLHMALGECIAHLNYLLDDQKLSRGLNAQGVYLYQSIDRSLSARAAPGSHHLDDKPVLV